MTSSPQYSGYWTPTVVPEPSIEWVAGADHLTVGTIGTNMLLRVPPWDWVVRLWVKSLHSVNCESHGGAHGVAPKAASELKAWADAKFHMYCFILC
jgi:hypothetical protein